MFGKMKNAIRFGMEEFKKTGSIVSAKDVAALSAGALAATIVIALVVILIAVSLLSPLFTAVNTVTSNTTLSAHNPSAISLVGLIPLVFAAGIVVMVVVIMFEKLKE